MPPLNDVSAREATGTAPTRDTLELWMALARHEWNSLVLVPGDPDISTAHLARSLAEVGQRLSYSPVTAVTIGSLEYGTAMALADLQQALEGGLRSLSNVQPLVEVPSAGASARAMPDDEGEAPPKPRPVSTTALAVVPSARLIISIPSVVSEPLGLAATQEADAVVVAVRMRHSKIPYARRTIDLVGRERVVGCVVVH